MSDRYTLKTCFVLSILPGNMQHIGLGFAVNNSESFHLIALIISRPSINPGSVRYDSAVLREHNLYNIEFDLSFRRTARGRVGFQKDRENLNDLERCVAVVGQLQRNSWLRVEKSGG